MEKPRAGVIVRWIVGTLIIGYGLFLLARMHNAGDHSEVRFDKSIFGVASLMVGVLFLGPEIVSWAVLPLCSMVDHLLLPSESEPPPANFKLARYYTTQLRHGEACEEYAKIIRYHPEERDAYLEGIRAARLAEDPKSAKTFYRRGKRVLRTRGERQLLTGVYTAHHVAEALPDQETDPGETPTEELTA